MERPTPVFVVCSPLPQVGKTLVARLLVEFFHADRRAIAAFDVNPDDYALAAQLPGLTTKVNIADTKGKMALFDRLIVADDVAKVVDLGYTSFEQFFTVMKEIDFEIEAYRRSIAPYVLFVAEPDTRSRQFYGKLRARFPILPVVPVTNAISATGSASSRPRDNLWLKFAATPLQIPYLSPALVGALQRSGLLTDDNFDFVNRELVNWARRAFLQFRELELRLLLERIKPALQQRA